MSTPPRRAARGGRRPGDSGTREAIAAAAREHFGQSGYDGTTVRAIAATAGVNPALVLYFYGSKQQLFVDVMRMPFDVAEAVERLVAGDRATIGRRLAAFVLGALDDPQARNVFLGRVRAAAADRDAAATLRGLITGELVGPLVHRLGVDRPELRAGLVSAALFGHVMTRWVVEIDAVVGMTADETLETLGAVLHLQLTGPLGGSTDPPDG